MARRLRVDEDGRQRLAQLVRERARQLAEHSTRFRCASSWRCAAASSSARLRSVMSRTMLRTLVAVAADDARLVEAFGVVRLQSVLDLLGLVDVHDALERAARASASGGGRMSLTSCRGRPRAARASFGGPWRDSRGTRRRCRQEHPVGNRAEDGAVAFLALAQRLLRAVMLDRDAAMSAAVSMSRSSSRWARAACRSTSRTSRALSSVARGSASTSRRAGRLAGRVAEDLPERIGRGCR